MKNKSNNKTAHKAKNNKKNKKKNKIATINEVLKDLKFYPNDFNRERKLKNLRGKKNSPHKIKFGENYKNCIDIAVNEGFIWKPENVAVRILGEGIPYSLNRIVRKISNRLSTKNNHAKVSKRETLRFLLSLDDIVESEKNATKLYAIKRESSKKLRNILMEKDSKREKAKEYFKENLEKKLSSKL